MVEARHLNRYQKQYFSYFDRYEILPNKYEMLNVSLFDLRKFYKNLAGAKLGSALARLRLS